VSCKRCNGYGLVYRDEHSGRLRRVGQPEQRGANYVTERCTCSAGLNAKADATFSTAPRVASLAHQLQFVLASFDKQPGADRADVVKALEILFTAREGRLRGALAALADAARGADKVIPARWPQRATLRGALKVARELDDESEWMSGDQACGWAFDLGAETAFASDIRPVLDALLESGGDATPLVLRMAEMLMIDTAGYALGFVELRAAAAAVCREFAAGHVSREALERLHRARLGTKHESGRTEAPPRRSPSR
jgi:hypothetical protein